MAWECKECGDVNPDIISYCPKCGNPIPIKESQKEVDRNE